MNAWSDPDGIALMLIFGVIGIVFLLFAMCVEYILARPMRSRRRRRQALERYARSIVGWPL